MKLDFKALLQKPWTLQEDRIIKGDIEILLTDIQNIELIAIPSFGGNGVIKITVDNKFIHLAYSNKYKDNGEKALKYIQDKCGINEEDLNKKSITIIKNELDSLPFNSHISNGELLELKEILGLDENIKAFIHGIINEDTWLVVCTDNRIFMLYRNLLFGNKLIEIPLDRINGISYSRESESNTIFISDGIILRTIENISTRLDRDVTLFVDIVNEEVDYYSKCMNEPVTQVVSTSSSADELIKYKQLLDMGAITQEEFDLKKKELLAL